MKQHEENVAPRTWHRKHSDTRTRGEIISDIVAGGMGSWKFIIIQTVIVIIWMILNIIGFIYHWDPYPFILLNLLFSTQAAYAAPIIMMAQNRQEDRDRVQALEDYMVNKKAKEEIESIQIDLTRIEDEKLNKIIAMLQELKNKQN